MSLGKYIVDTNGIEYDKIMSKVPIIAMVLFIWPLFIGSKEKCRTTFIRVIQRL